MKAILLAALISILFALPVFCQKSMTLEGAVADSAGVGLPGATVILMEKKDSTLSAFGVTEADGRFALKKIAPGGYLLQVSFVGFGAHWQAVAAAGGERLDLGKITLLPATANLGVVEVAGERVPMRFGGDTVEYNAAAFKVQPGAVVEDLLKKLPGVEVQSDGSIRAQGEQVQNVLVDGKEFFGSDPQVATKNLPADAVDKVQVYDKKSDMAEFSGIEDGRDEKTINLALKEDRKQGYFGNAVAGGGTEERYQGRFNLNRFSKNSQLSALGMANNTNQAGFSFNDYLNFMGGLSGLMQGGGGGGGGRSVRLSFDTGGNGVPLEGGVTDGFLTTWAGGANLNREFGSKTKLNSSYFFSKIRNDVERFASRQNLLGGETYASAEDEDRRSQSLSHRLNLTLRHELDSFQNFILRSSFSLTDARFDSEGGSQTFGGGGFLENEGSRAYRSDGDRLNLSSNLTYRRRFRKKGRALVGDLSFGLGSDERRARLLSENFFYQNPPDTASLNQRQTFTDEAANWGASASYTEPLGKAKYLEVNASRQNYRNETAKEFYDRLPGGGEETFNPDLSQRYRRGYVYERGGLNFLLNRSKFNLTAGAAAERSSLESRLPDEGEDLKKSYVRLLPAAFFNYEPGIGRNFGLEYQTSLREPSPEQLQPTVDNADPLSTFTGNPNLRPEYAHNLSARFMRFDQFTFTSFFAGLEGSLVKDRITNASTVDSLFRRNTRPVNTPKETSLRGYLDFSTPVRPLKMTVRMNLNSTWSRGVLFVNDVENDATRLSHSLDFSLSNRKKDVVDATLGVRLTHNKTAYSVDEALNQTYLNKRFYAELTVLPSKKWEVGSRFRYLVYSAESFGGEQKVPLWEASLSRYVLKNNRGKLTLSGFDLLDENIGIRRTSELNYVQEERIRSLGRYVMLTFAYSISGFNKEPGGIEIRMDRED